MEVEIDVARGPIARAAGVLALFLLLALLFEYFVGTYQGALPLDLFCFFIPAIAAAVILWRGDFKPENVVVVAFLSTLVAITVCDWLFHSTPLIRRASARPAVTGSPAVGLALSGGGFRAALFHAGVLSVLEERRIPVRVMSSVSGGSIFASFYAVGGTPQQFRDALLARRFNLKRELLHVPNLVRLIGPRLLPLLKRWSLFNYTRTEVQAAMLDRLFLHGRRHDALTTRPALMLCTTDIYGSDMIGVLPRGIVEQRITTSVERSCFANPAAVGFGQLIPPSFTDSQSSGLPGSLPSAKLVAASGAFPGAFEALHVTTPIETSVLTHDTLQYLLADGGVGDNLGLVLLYGAHQLASYSQLARENRLQPSGVLEQVKQWPIDEWQIDLAIASDASAISSEELPRTSLAQVGRSIDVVYAATGGDQMTGRVDPQVTLPPTVLISPRSILSAFRPADLRRGTPDAVHLYFGTEMVLRLPPPPGEKDLPPPPANLMFTAIAPATMDAMIANMPASERSAARWALRALAISGVYRNGQWNGPTFAPPSPERRLYELVRAELFRRVHAFVTTSTLEDQIPRDDVLSIYLLGRYLAMLNLPYIDYELALKRSASPRLYGRCGPLDTAR